MNRRRFAATAGSALLASRLAQDARAEQGCAPATRDSWHPATQKEISQLSGPPLQIGMLLFPDMVSLDFFGPYTFLAGLMNVNVHLLWKNLDPVTTDKGMADQGVRILPSTKLADCPKELDVLFVPGGLRGVTPLMRDDAVLDFLADRAPHARYVTSVCTGALLLGAAGLLRGYKATTHWGSRDILPVFGAIPVDQRIAEDRNRITGGGVTAGIDFGLTIAGRVRGDSFARLCQLAYEYDPDPPYRSGSPHQASEELVAHVRDMDKRGQEEARAAARDAMSRRNLA